MQTVDTGVSPQVSEIVRGMMEGKMQRWKRKDDFHGLKTDFRGYDGSSRILASNCNLYQTES